MNKQNEWFFSFWKSLIEIDRRVFRIIAGDRHPYKFRFFTEGVWLFIFECIYVIICLDYLYKL